MARTHADTGCGARQPQDAPPLRWVSPAERFWDDQFVYRACIDLLEREPLERRGPEQRVAHLCFHAERALRERGLGAFLSSSSAARVRETLAALRKLGAGPQADWIAARRTARARKALGVSGFESLEPAFEAVLRRYLDAYAAYFVRVARPSCT
jgi:hypothetical protein